MRLNGSIIVLVIAALTFKVGESAAQVAEAPAEVVASAPVGSKLVYYLSSGDQAGADAIAVYEGDANAEGVRYRDLAVFDKTNSLFVKAFTTEKILACSECTGFDAGSRYDDTFKVGVGRIEIEQVSNANGDPAFTTVVLRREGASWVVAEAVREPVRNGQPTVKLLAPKSGLAKDMDLKWRLLFRQHALVVNDHTNFWTIVQRGEDTGPLLKNFQRSCGSGGCTVLITQRDGCIALVRDASGRSFGGAAKGRKDGALALERAMRLCSGSESTGCSEIRTSCWAESND